MIKALNPDSVYNQILESGSAPDLGKMLLLRIELMLNIGTDCLGVAFILKAMPKLDHLGVLSQKLYVEGRRCLDGVSQLPIITPHSHIGADTISHLCIVAQKY